MNSVEDVAEIDNTKITTLFGKKLIQAMKDYSEGIQQNSTFLVVLLYLPALKDYIILAARNESVTFSFIND